MLQKDTGNQRDFISSEWPSDLLSNTEANWQLLYKLSFSAGWDTKQQNADVHNFSYFIV